MPEMITVRCPRCGKKLLFSPFENYKKATLECPGCHYNGLVETYPEIPTVPQSNQQRPQQGQGGQVSNSPNNPSRPSAPRTENASGNRNASGIRDLDGTSSNASSSSSSNSNSRRSPRSNGNTNSNSQNGDQPSGFALKFPWVIAGLALVIIILYICLQCISTNEVI